jgi:hypothetical protein
MQRRRRIATKRQPIPLDPRKSRARFHQLGVSGAADVLRPLEIFYTAARLQWDAARLLARGCFRHAPKLSPVLEILSSSLVLRNNLESQIKKPKSVHCRAAGYTVISALTVCHD